MYISQYVKMERNYMWLQTMTKTAFRQQKNMLKWICELDLWSIQKMNNLLSILLISMEAYYVGKHATRH